MTKNTGGFAFPRPEGEMTFAENGMTLRDWFAGQFLGSVEIKGNVNAAIVAKHCYAMADAMIAERDK